MNRKAIFIFGLIVLFLATAYFSLKFERENTEKSEYSNDMAYQKNNSANTNIMMVNAEEEKTTPNTELILKKIYTDCGDEISNSAEIPEEMVNLTKEELKKEYSSWDIEEFSKTRVVLTKRLDSFCGEHYLVKEEESKICIYKLDEENHEILQEELKTEVKYLPETDRILLKNGIYVNGMDELNKIKEDYR